MPGYNDRASILQGAGDMIFKLVCERSTPEQWAEWLRAPLEHAAGTANYDLVKKLVKAGADGSAGWKGCQGKTRLHAAAEGGDGQVISTLVRAGAEADMEAKTPSPGRTPLHLAVFRGKQAAAGALVMAGADVNILDANGDTSLHLAIEPDHVRIAKDLLLSGADPSKIGSKGEYPVYLAASRGHDEVVQALVHKRANLNCLGTRGGNTPLTPLAVAVRADRDSVVECLLAGRADANFRMQYSKTALHTAVEHNKPAAIPALIESGADIEARSDAGMTPLATAPTYGSCAAMIALLRLGASVNTKNNRGWTPLHAACRKGSADAADLLLRWGSDETMVTSSGKIPSQHIPDFTGANDEDRPKLERLAKLLANAPQDRAWRRRGFVTACRAHQVRLRLVVEIPDSGTEDIDHQLRERPSRRARTGKVKVEVQTGGGHARGAVAGDARSSNGGRSVRRAGGRGGGGGFDGVAAWLMAVADEQVFRKIVGFL